MAAAAAEAAARGVSAMVGFTYRRVPAIALARQLVADGRHRRRPARPRAVPAGLDRRPGGARCPGGWTRTRRARARSATSARTSSTSRSSSPARPLTGVSGDARDLRQGAAARRGRPAGLLGGIGGARDGPGHRGRRRPLPRPASAAARLATFEATRFALGPQERHPDRDQRLGRQPGVRLRGHERPAATSTAPSRPRRPGSAGSSSPSRSTRTWPRGGRRARARLRARLHPPGGRPGHGDRRADGTRCPRSPTACTCSGCWPPWSAVRRQQLHAWHRRSDSNERTLIDGPTRSPCSPASGPTCRSRRWPGWPPGGATTAWRSPAGATTSTSRAPRTTTTTSPEQARAAGAARPEGLRDLQPPQRARRSATTRSTSGTATSCPTRVWGDGDPEGVRQRAAEEMKTTARTAPRARRRRRSSGSPGRAIWKYVAMFPPASAGDDRRRLPGLRRPVEPDPRRVRRGRRAVRARGAPAARSPTTTGRPCARWRRSGTARRSG